jgi:hypothetical protein
MHSVFSGGSGVSLIAQSMHSRSTVGLSIRIRLTGIHQHKTMDYDTFQNRRNEAPLSWNRFVGSRRMTRDPAHTVYAPIIGLAQDQYSIGSHSKMPDPRTAQHLHSRCPVESGRLSSPVTQDRKYLLRDLFLPAFGSGSDAGE